MNGAEPAENNSRSSREELERILKLPQREPLNCERDMYRRLVPEAEALVDIMTAKFSRGPRLSCGCAPRKIQRTSNGVIVFRATFPNLPPLPPIEFDTNAFLADNAHDLTAVTRVGNMRREETIELSGLGRLSCVTRFNAVQSWILREMPRAGGILGFISVGGGKSFASILAPLAVPGIDSALLLAKPDQRLHYRQAYLQLREHFKVPSIVFDQGIDSMVSLDPSAPTLRFIPYSMLSNPKSTQLLESLTPKQIIADEGHLLASRISSRTGRFLRYMIKAGHVIFCIWSGSMIKKSLKDVSHLSAHALGMSSPYPIAPIVAESWAKVVDPTKRPDVQSEAAKMLYRAFGVPLEDTRFYMFADSTAVREKHRDLVVRTPGVISTVSSSVSCSIVIKEWKPRKMPEAVRDALSSTRLGLRPDGEELVEQTDILAASRNVACGGHYYWAYPRGESIELINEWFAARKEWNKELRQKLFNNEPFLDSPKLCADAAIRAYQKPRYDGPLPVWPAKSWPEWSEIKDQVKPDDGRWKWLDDWFARDAADWAKSHRGIVWTSTSFLGQKIAQLAGINYHGGGPTAEADILAEDGSRSIVASIKAHGESRDGLQYKFCEQLIVEPMPGGDRWEQLLGRLAREGQPEDVVETYVNRHVYEFTDAWEKALMYAEFIENTTPNRQLLLAADVEF